MKKLLIYTLGIIGVALPLAPISASAEGCPAREAVSLYHSCAFPAQMTLRFMPLDMELKSRDFLAVTGAYSSGDRYGVEGLAMNKGQMISRRFQGWDGILIVDAQGVPEIHNTNSVHFEGRVYNLKTQPDRRDFTALAQTTGASVIQSHLLISDGALDLQQVEPARRFIRRMAFQDAHGWGIFETEKPMTLYEAAVQIQEDLNPYMALNLDMGAYNYCRMRRSDQVDSCGNLYVTPDKLTNLLVLSLPETH
ncbi:hypothetical protein GCM10007939_07880 [Amylibacter marinus]|uniref:Phosphodiester glycosidase domain-containing protein n=1 Tax=Amylibacter marinus TaxID=1475483 RepID=A0ABQ5VSU9_9RHOB|nr:succinate dehydrogenase [Amylibacter marinus]GLQ34505.1 hypothetical protein GCM10007939_07880 [Amylibacter marinus]